MKKRIILLLAIVSVTASFAANTAFRRGDFEGAGRCVTVREKNYDTAIKCPGQSQKTGQPQATASIKGPDARKRQ